MCAVWTCNIDERGSVNAADYRFESDPCCISIVEPVDKCVEGYTHHDLVHAIWLKDESIYEQTDFGR